MRGKSQIVLREITPLSEMRMIDGGHGFLSCFGLFHRPQVFQLGHVVGMAGIPRKRLGICKVHFRHDIRDAYHSGKRRGLCSYDQTATLLGRHIQSVRADLIQHIARYETTIEIRVQFKTVRHGVFPDQMRMGPSIGGGPGAGVYDTRGMSATTECRTFPAPRTARIRGICATYEPDHNKVLRSLASFRRFGPELPLMRIRRSRRTTPPRSIFRSTS